MIEYFFAEQVHESRHTGPARMQRLNKCKTHSDIVNSQLSLQNSKLVAEEPRACSTPKDAFNLYLPICNV